MPNPTESASVPIRFRTFLIALAAYSLVAAAAPLASADATADSLSRGMAEYAAGLSSEQRKTALYAFDDEERLDLRLAPLGLEGLRIDEMTEAQWARLESLLGGVLSEAGMVKLNTIRSLEREVRESEGGLFGFIMDRIREPKRYFLALFGEPSTESAWGFRFDGHHVSLNATAVPGAPLSATPLFLGGQPANVPAEFERAGLRVLGAEEDLAIAFLNGLSPAKRGEAYVPLDEGGAFIRPMSISAPIDFVLPEASGLDRAGLAPAGQTALDALIDVLLGNFEPSVATRYRAEIIGGNAPVTFTYASAADTPTENVVAGQAFYYRIQGGGLSVEFDNTSEEAQHIHLVYRHAENDFGRDLLAEHHAAAH